jgi:hypothetical protein
VFVWRRECMRKRVLVPTRWRVLKRVLVPARGRMFDGKYFYPPHYECLRVLLPTRGPMFDTEYLYPREDACLKHHGRATSLGDMPILAKWRRLWWWWSWYICRRRWLEGDTNTEFRKLCCDFIMRFFLVPTSPSPLPPSPSYKSWRIRFPSSVESH